MKGRFYSMIPNTKQHYTYKDYLAWDTEERYELINGIPYLLAAPSTEHQRISFKLSLALGNFFKGSDCEVFVAPFDVVLFKNIGYYDENKIDCVVQPDISVICDKNKFNEKGCKGSPNLIIEILSDSTASKDYIEKLGLYQFNEVLEYWIVSPKNKSIQVFLLKNGMYGEPLIYTYDSAINSSVFSDLKINLQDIF